MRIKRLGGPGHLVDLHPEVMSGLRLACVPHGMTDNGIPVAVSAFYPVTLLEISRTGHIEFGGQRGRFLALIGAVEACRRTAGTPAEYALDDVMGGLVGVAVLVVIAPEHLQGFGDHALARSIAARSTTSAASRLPCPTSP